MEFKLLKIIVEGPVATILINRPEVLNAINPQLLTELSVAVTEFELDDRIAVVVLSGEGKGFVAGADISVMESMGSQEARYFSELGGDLAKSIEESAKPYIAAVNGFALGGGCELALACDFIYASEKAKFGQPEVCLGVIPGFGGTQRLSRRIGISKAKELVFTGKVINAAKALEIGLIDKLCAPEILMADVMDTATSIAKNGPLAVAEAKRVMHVGQSMGLDHGNQLEQLAFASLFETADQREGMTAFLAKRSPEFKGE